MKKALLAKRSYGYLVGICILPAGTLGFLAGFVSPYWHFVRTATGTVTVHGLWLVCYQVSSSLVGCDQTIIRADSKRETERDRDRETETDRHTDRHADRERQ